MRKILLAAFVGLVSIALVYGVTYAAVSGDCSYCHTMHYSQDGAPLSDWGAEGPYGQLLIDGCLGCHTGTNDGTVPYVYSTSTPTYGTNTLAGGSFWGSDNATDSTVHNVDGINQGADDNIKTGPPGFKGSVPLPLPSGETGPATWPGIQQITCAGVYGCHGNRTVTDGMAAISTAHHANTNLASTDAPTSVASSYRFLYGIKGLEDGDWEYTVLCVNHNGYYGVDDFSSLETISYLCAECHGDFHAKTNPSEVGTGSPWLRHPTDKVLSEGEYLDYDTYDVITPPAFKNPTTKMCNIIDGTAIVMCLSCHRAHGSPYPDMLRWDYSTMIAGGTSEDTGCFTCHTTKNVAPVP